MLREHQFLHDLARPSRARITFRARFSQSGSLNSSGADPKQHLKEISIQTLGQVHFKSIQLDSSSIEPKKHFPFQFNFETIIHVTLNSMHFKTISNTINSIQFKLLSIQCNSTEFKIKYIQTGNQVNSI